MRGLSITVKDLATLEIAATDGHAGAVAVVTMPHCLPEGFTANTVGGAVELLALFLKGADKSETVTAVSEPGRLLFICGNDSKRIDNHCDPYPDYRRAFMLESLKVGAGRARFGAKLFERITKAATTLHGKDASFILNIQNKESRAVAAVDPLDNFPELLSFDVVIMPQRIKE